jgi:hypothetical protein
MAQLFAAVASRFFSLGYYFSAGLFCCTKTSCRPLVPQA